METQISKTRVENLRVLLGYQSAFAVGSNGRGGGLCLYWKNDINLSVRVFKKYHIDATVSEVDKHLWRLVLVYGEANRSLWYRTWELLRNLRGDSDMPWVCIGDFNEILRNKEQFGPK